MEYKILLGVAVLIGIVAFIYPPEEPYFYQFFGDDTDLMILPMTSSNETTVDGAVIIAEPLVPSNESTTTKGDTSTELSEYIISPNEELIISINPMLGDTHYSYPKVQMTEKWNEYTKSEQETIVKNIGDKVVEIVNTTQNRNPSTVEYYVKGTHVADYTYIFKIINGEYIQAYEVYLY